MLKKFNDLSPLHFYRYICKGDVGLSVLKEMPDDKLYDDLMDGIWRHFAREEM